MSEQPDIRGFERDLATEIAKLNHSDALSYLHKQLEVHKGNAFKTNAIYGEMYRLMWYTKTSPFIVPKTEGGPPPAIYRADSSGLYLMEREGMFRLFPKVESE